MGRFGANGELLSGVAGSLWRRSARYRPALVNIAEDSTPSASAMRNKLIAVTLRSPRSILPMCDRSISAWCASFSCDVPEALRRDLIAEPRAFKRRMSSWVRSLLDTAKEFQRPSKLATGYTAHLVLAATVRIAHVLRN